MHPPSTAGFLDATDWVVISVYLVGMIALGAWFRRGQKNTRDYFLGNRSVPWWGIGLSIVAAETSALTIIGVPAMSYGGSMLFIQMIFGYVIARVILAIVLVPHYFRGEIYSPYELFGNTFGPPARQMAGGMFLLSETLAAGVRVYVACIPVQLMLGVPVVPALVLFIGLSLIYTYLGGVKAVIWTDAVQFGLFLLGGLFTILYIAFQMDDGFQGIMHDAQAAGKLTWLQTNLHILHEGDFTKFLQATLAEPFNLWMGLLGGTVMVLSSHGADQLVVQRVLACRQVADGRKALVLSAVVIFPLFVVFLLAGAMLWVYYQRFPMAIPIPEVRPGIKANDFVFPIFMLTAVPHLLRGFLIVAVLAAAMSSVSSALTSLSSVSTMDFFRHMVRGRSEEFYLRFSRYSTIVWAAGLGIVAYLSREVTFVLNAAFSLRGLTSGALLGGLCLAVFWKKGRATPVVVGMGCAVVTMAAIQLLPHYSGTHEMWTKRVGGEIFWPWFTLIGALVTLGVAFLLRPFLGRPETTTPDLGSASLQGATSNGR